MWQPCREREGGRGRERESERERVTEIEREALMKVRQPMSKQSGCVERKVPMTNLTDSEGRLSARYTS